MLSAKRLTTNHYNSSTAEPCCVQVPEEPLTPTSPVYHSPTRTFERTPLEAAPPWAIPIVDLIFAKYVPADMPSSEQRP